jgi:UDP-2,3-diacylglucosamine pyrophosphatase LpxH
MHKEFLDLLSQVAHVKLVAKMKNDKIGFPYPDDIRIFIPDFHMYSKCRQEEAKYTCYTNYFKDKDDLLPQTVRAIARFKADFADKTVEIYQLGDFIDLWRETLLPCDKKISELKCIIQRVIESNAAVWDVLMDDNFQTNFLLGNHDFDLRRDDSISEKFRFLRHYINDISGSPVIGMLHGDLFSWIEQLPVGIRQLCVYYLSPRRKDDDKNKVKKAEKTIFDLLEKWIKESHKIGDIYIDYQNYNDNAEPFNIGELAFPGDVEGDEWNVKRKGQTTDGKYLRFLDDSKNFFTTINKEHDYKVRMVVLGHTHCARIALDETDNGFFLLMDCGAWIKEFTGKVKQGDKEIDVQEKSAQIGVLSDNDVRIYQLSPK